MSAAGEIRVIFGGSMPGGEEFSTGFSVDGSGGFDQAGLNTLLTSVSTAFSASTFLTDWQASNTDGVVIRTISAYYYAAPGPASLVAEQAHTFPGSSSSAVPMPNQCAVVLTLNTGRPGRSYRGRMYWPMNIAARGHDGLMTATQAQNYAQHLAAFFTTLNGTYSVHPVVASTTKNSLTAITAVSCDTRVDVQRRRGASETSTRYSYNV